MTDSDDDDYEHIDFGRQPEDGPDSGDGRKRGLPEEQTGPGGLHNNPKKRRDETISKNLWRIGGSHPIRMKLDQIVDNRMAKAWKSIIPFLNYRDKYNLFNTCKFFRYTLDLSSHGVEEIEKINLLVTQRDKAICRSYCDPRWSFYRAFSWIQEQHVQSKWTQWKFFFREKRHPNSLAMLAKSEILSELIDNEHVSVTSSEIGEYLNRPSIYCRDLTESPDWFILFDVVTDQLLVLDLSTGWLDVKRLSFYIHQNSLHHGIKNYDKLKDGNFLKDDEFFVFTDIVNGSPLHILNLETETVRIIEGSINTLFFEKFPQYQFFDDIKSNKLNINTGAVFNGVVRKPILLAINKLNRQNWNNITIHKIKLEDAQNRSDNSLALDLVYYMKIETENFPKVNFVFMATFIVRENEKMLLSDILYMGVREMPIPNKGKTVY